MDKLINEVLLKILHGDNKYLKRLMKQLSQFKIKTREMSGVGFFYEFEVPDELSINEIGDMSFGDVIGEIEGVKNGVGFILFIKDGKLDMLEGYTYDEPWPPSIKSYTLNYMNDKRDLPEILR